MSKKPVDEPTPSHRCSRVPRNALHAALADLSPALTVRGRGLRCLRAVFAPGLLAAAVTGCGHSGPRPPGPNVAGLSLRAAEHELNAHHLGFMEHLESGPLAIGKHGGTIRRGWIVCSEGYVNAQMVELNTWKEASC